jgi:hypothetical protein
MYYSAVEGTMGPLLSILTPQPCNLITSQNLKVQNPNSIKTYGLYIILDISIAMSFVLKHNVWKTGFPSSIYWAQLGRSQPEDGDRQDLVSKTLHFK